MGDDDRFFAELRACTAELARIIDGDLERPVPARQGWTLKQLATHVGRGLAAAGRRLGRSRLAGGAGAGGPGDRGLEPVTNQVTTASGGGRRSATRSDSEILLTCGNQT